MQTYFELILILFSHVNNCMISGFFFLETILVFIQQFAFLQEFVEPFIVIKVFLG